MNLVIVLVIFTAMNLFLAVGTRQILSSYEKKSIEQRISYARKSIGVLSNQVLINGLASYNMANVPKEKGANVTELIQLANDLEGRIMIVDSHFKVVADTYDQHCGQYYVTEDLFRIFQGERLDHKLVGDFGVQLLTGVYDKEAKTIKAVIIAVISVQNRNRIAQHLSSQRMSLLGIFFLVSLVLCALAFFWLRGMFGRMQEELDMIEAGHQEAGMAEEGFREFYNLSASFNRIINRYRELENTRQEFLSNVSHELKTPITSMKILADSLLMQEDVPAELYQEFMHDIVHEINRENQIITDLLELVKMDKSKAQLNISLVNIYDLLQEILKRISPIAEERGITMRLETMRPVTAEVDAVKLSLACNNLIENAVKYNNDGGNVDVSLNADHKFFYIRVKDTGVGIPEDCQEQIFERFYRVDKARSRDTGGTGLGLAIARNVILLHKGSIRVHSKTGEGSTFTVRIPLNYLG